MVKRIIALVLFISLAQPLSLAQQPAQQEYVPSVYGKIAQELLNQVQEHLTGYQKFTVFKMFDEHENLIKKDRSYSVVNTDDIRKDLELFNQANLLERFKRTTTVWGHAVFARLLAEPTADITELTRRQTIIKKLVEDEQLFNTIDAALNEIKKVEPLFIARYSPVNDSNQNALKSLYFDAGFWEMFPAYSPAWDKSEKGLLVSEILHKGKTLLFALATKWRLQNAANLLAVKENGRAVGYDGYLKLFSIWSAVYLGLNYPPLFGAGCAVGAVGGIGYGGYKGIQKGRELVNNPGIIGARAGNMSAGIGQGLRSLGTWNGLKNGMSNTWNFIDTKGQQGSSFLTSLEAAIDLPFNVFQEGRTLASWKKLLAWLQDHMKQLGSAIEKMEDISLSLSKTSDIFELAPETKPLVDLFKKPENASEDMRNLLKMLDTKTFKGKTSIFSHVGRISASNKLMEATKLEWVSMFEAIGYLDAYMSVARLIKEYKNSPVQIDFANYIKANKPTISFEDFWSPLVDPKVVVVNMLQLGHDVAGNMILTGPNTGGKSTIIKAIALNILLAQTLCITCGKCSLTPFSAINTYMNISDDVAKGLSLFASEVDRAKKLVNKIATLPQDKFSFTIIDEMFRGTPESHAEILSYEYGKALSAMNNSMCLEATHYHKLINLEQETQGRFTNFKVEVDVLADGSLKRHYRLERGWTKQNVAAHICKEQGLLPILPPAA